MVEAGILPLYLYTHLPKYTTPSGSFLYHSVSSKVLPAIDATLSETSIDVKAVQPEKLDELITTWSEILMDVRAVHFSNAFSPIATPFGISIDAKPVQPEKT